MTYEYRNMEFIVAEISMQKPRAAQFTAVSGVGVPWVRARPSRFGLPVRLRAEVQGWQSLTLNLKLASGLRLVETVSS